MCALAVFYIDCYAHCKCIRQSYYSTKGIYPHIHLPFPCPCFITRQQCVMCCHWTATLRPFILSCTRFPSLTLTVLRINSEPQQHTFIPVLCAVSPSTCWPSYVHSLSVSYCVKFLRWEWAFQQQLWGLYINAHTGPEGYIYRLHTLSVCTCVCASGP